MKTIRRLLAVVLLIVLVVALFQNQESLGLAVEFAFFHWSFSLVLGFWLLFAFIAGAALFAVLDAWKGMLRRLENRRRDQETEALRAELERLTGGDRSGNREGSAPPR